MSVSGVVRAVTTMVLLVFQYENLSPGSDFSTSADSSSCVGLVLARKGSKGIPRKNLAMLNGHPLIHWVLEEMIQSQEFSSIWVSTNDPEVKEYVTKNKPLVQVHDRAWYTATDEATSLIAVQEFLSFHPDVGTIGLVQATSPFLLRTYLQEAVAQLNTYNLDSIFSVTRQRKLRWSSVSENEIKAGQWTKPLNFDPSRRPRRQDSTGELVENGMFYFARRQIILDGLLQGKRSYYVEIPFKHSLDIDTMDDLNLANALMHQLKYEQNTHLNLNTTDIPRNSSKIEL